MCVRALGRALPHPNEWIWTYLQWVVDSFNKMCLSSAKYTLCVKQSKAKHSQMHCIHAKFKVVVNIFRLKTKCILDTIIFGFGIRGFLPYFVWNYTIYTKVFPVYRVPVLQSKAAAAAKTTHNKKKKRRKTSTKCNNT